MKIKRDTGEECIVSLEDLSFKDIKFGEDDIIQIVTRQDLEDQYNKQKSESSSRKNSDEQSDSENKEGSEKKEPSPPKPEPVEYTPEQLEYVQKLKESFDFPYAFPRNKMAMKKEPHDYDMYDEETFLMRSRLPHYRRNPIVDNQIFRKLMLQKRPTILNKKVKDDSSPGSSLFSEDSNPGISPISSSANGSVPVYPVLDDSPLRSGEIAKNTILRPPGSIIKSKLIKCKSQEKGRSWKEEGEIRVSRDRVQSEPVSKTAGQGRVRTASDSALGSKESGRESPFLLSDDSGTVSDGEFTDGGSDRIEQRNRPRKRFRKYSSSRERLGSGGSSECDEETVKPDHVYRFKFKSVSETQDYPYMSARPSSLLKLVKLDKCDYPVGCRSAPFLFDTRPLTRVLDRGPFVRQYDIEPTSENVWSGVSLWAGDDSSDNMSDTSSNNGSSHSAPESLKCPSDTKKLPSSLMRKIVSAGNSPIRRSSEGNLSSKSPEMSGLDILSSVAYNADRLRNTPTKRQRTPRKQQPTDQRSTVKQVTPLKLQVRHIRVASKRKPENEESTEHSKIRKLDT